jgi:hypothetical protein
MTPPETPRARTALVLVAVVVVLAASVWIRWPGFTQGGFASHDVGGILYEAMVLAGGGLPYVDTVELKAPGRSMWRRCWPGPTSRRCRSRPTSSRCCR